MPWRAVTETKTVVVDVALMMMMILRGTMVVLVLVDGVADADGNPCPRHHRAWNGNVRGTDDMKYRVEVELVVEVS